MKEIAAQNTFLWLSEKVEIEVSPVYELIIAPLKAYGLPGDSKPGWSRSVKKKLSSRSRETLHFFFEEQETIGMNALNFLLELQPPRKVEDLLNLIENMNPTKFARELISRLDPSIPNLDEILLKIITKGNLSKAEKEQYKDFLSRYSKGLLLRLKTLLKDSFWPKDFTLFLREFWEIFLSSEYEKIYPSLKEYAQRISSLPSASGELFLEEIAPDLDIALENKRKKIIVAPSLYAQPFYFSSSNASSFLLIVPLPQGQEQEIEGIKSELSQAFKSLGDPVRLEILHLLAQRPMYAMEISRQLSLTHPTVLHHLASLRAMGFVTTEIREGNSYYQLRKERIGEMAKIFQKYLTNFASDR